MIRRMILLVVALAISSASSVIFSFRGQEAQKVPPAPQPARKIPGVTAEDAFPGGCVSCHVNRPDLNLDARLSSMMSQWNKAVEPELLAKAQGAAPAGVTLKGKHPVVAAALKNIPAGCLTCHSKGSKVAPPFARMLHRIHLAGGEENHFLTMFQGECTHCHKLNQATGQWSLASGAEP